MSKIFQTIKQNKFATVVTILLIVVISLFINSSVVSNSFDGLFESEGTYSSSRELSNKKDISPESSASLDQITKSEKKIVKNGSLSVLVEKVNETVNSIKVLAESFAGSIDSVNIYNVTDDTKAGQVIVRVPNEKFDEAMVGLKKLAVKVNNERVDTTDVTAQYVDLESNLKNYQAVEKQYIDILKSAKNVEETLAVYQKLSEVRGRIESIQGQINYLSRQVSMSTISINMTSEEDVSVFGIIWHPLTVLKQAFRNFLVDMVDLANRLLLWAFKLPGILIRLALLFVVFVLGKKLYRVIGTKMNTKKRK